MSEEKINYNNSDALFLIWIYQRLNKVHNESEMVGYMQRLKNVISNLDPSVNSNHQKNSDLSIAEIEQDILDKNKQ